MKQRDCISFIVAILCLGAVLIAYFDLFNKWVSLIAIGLMDLYLLTALLAAAAYSDEHSNFTDNWVLPNKIVGLVVVVFFSIVLTFGFAHVYYKMSKTPAAVPVAGTDSSGNFNKPFATKTDALYFSVVTAATVGFGDIPVVSKPAKGTVIFQIFSGILLFFGAFPLLISRMSNFREKKTTDTPAQKTAIIITPGEKISITVDGKIWEEKKE